jgi:hypothetical protein
MHDGIDRRQREWRRAFQIGVDGRRTQCPEFRVGRRRTRESEHLMAVSCELRDQAPPEKAGTSGDENMHDDQPFDSGVRMVPTAFSRMSSRTSVEGGTVLRN